MQYTIKAKTIERITENYMKDGSLSVLTKQVYITENDDGNGSIFFKRISIFDDNNQIIPFDNFCVFEDDNQESEILLFQFDLLLPFIHYIYNDKYDLFTIVIEMCDDDTNDCVEKTRQLIKW